MQELITHPQSVDIPALLQDLYFIKPEKPLSKEHKAKLLLELELYLIGAKPPIAETTDGPPPTETLKQRQLEVEKQWIALEKARMKETGKSGVLSPEKNKLLRDVFIKVKNAVGGAAIAYGRPGEGKDTFLEILADLLESEGLSNGSVITAGTPLSSSLDAFSKDRTTPKSLLSTTILNLLENVQEKDDLVRILKAYLEYNSGKFTSHDTTTRRTYPEIVKKQLKLKIPEGNVQDLDQWLSDVIDANNGYSTLTQELKHVFKQLEIDELLAGDELRDYGPLHEAAIHGLTITVRDAGRTGINGLLRYGHGIEELLQAEIGKTKTVGGVNITIEEGFRVFISLNDETIIEEHIDRRFGQKIKFSTETSEYIWIARVLLSDEKGDSILDPKDENELTQFLLWWEALGKHKTKSFTTNALHKLCTELKRGESFGRALSNLLSSNPEINTLYQACVARGDINVLGTAVGLGGETDKTDSNYLTLAELNWQMNARLMQEVENDIISVQTIPGELNQQVENSLGNQEQLRNQPTVFVEHDPSLNGGSLKLSINEGNNLETGGVDTRTVLHRSLSELDDLADKTIGKPIGSPAGQTATVLHGEWATLVDMPSGETMPIINEMDESGEINWQDENQILNVAWITETKGYMVVKKKKLGGNPLAIVTFRKEDRDFDEDQKTTGVVLKPSIIIDSEKAVVTPPEAGDTEPQIDFSQEMMLLTWRKIGGGQDQQITAQQLYRINLDFKTQPIMELPLGSEEYSIHNGVIGTFIASTGDGQTTMRWLKI